VPEVQTGITSFLQQTLSMLNDEAEANSDDGDGDIEQPIELIH